MHWKMWSRRPKSRWNMHGKSLFPVINPDCMNRRDIEARKKCICPNSIDRAGHKDKENIRKNKYMTQPEILYEDAQLIVCYKPAGIATQTKNWDKKTWSAYFRIT